MWHFNNSDKIHSIGKSFILGQNYTTKGPPVANIGRVKIKISITLEGKSSGGTAGGCSSGPITLRYTACKAADFFAVFNDGDLDSSLRWTQLTHFLWS